MRGGEVNPQTYHPFAVLTLTFWTDGIKKAPQVEGLSGLEG